MWHLCDKWNYCVSGEKISNKQVLVNKYMPTVGPMQLATGQQQEPQYREVALG